jgi:hypothetical protein
VLPQSGANAMTMTLNPFGGAPTAADMARSSAGEQMDFFNPMKVEAIIPPGLLQHFQVVFDYGARTMTLAAPGALAPDGVMAPIRINRSTGFASIDVTVKGRRHSMVIDNGGSYTALKDAGDWPVTDQEIRSAGGIGPANYMMQPGGIDAASNVVRLPQATLGALVLSELNGQEIATPGMLGFLLGGAFWDSYSEKAGEETEGWLGGNLLKNFRLTLDYPNRRSYWLRQGTLDTSLDQVGIVLGRSKEAVTITGIARKGGVPTVTGVEAGDQLLRIGNLDVATATRGQMLSALSGKPGEMRRLLLERDGRRLEVDVPVTGF